MEGVAAGAQVCGWGTEVVNAVNQDVNVNNLQCRYLKTEYARSDCIFISPYLTLLSLITPK